MAHRKRKPFAAYFFTTNIFTEAYTEQLLHQKLCTHAFYTRAFLITAQAFFTGNNFTAATLPHQKQKFLFTKQLCHQKPMIHPYYHANHDPRMNCHGLYAKYNISVCGYLSRKQFVRDVLQERKCNIAPVTLHGPMPPKSLHLPRRVTHQYKWHTNISKYCMLLPRRVTRQYYQILLWFTLLGATLLWFVDFAHIGDKF